MTRVLRFNGASAAAGNVSDGPIAAADLTGSDGILRSYREAVLPGIYKLPFKISLQVVKGSSRFGIRQNGIDGELIQGVNNPGQGVHEDIWIQISAGPNYLDWITISPVAFAAPDLSNTFASTPEKMPTILTTEVPTHRFKKFVFESGYTVEDPLIQTLYQATSDTEFKIRILNSVAGGGFAPTAVHYAIADIQISSPGSTVTRNEVITRDNQFVRHQIPRSDISYSWIRNAVEREEDPQDTSSPHGLRRAVYNSDVLNGYETYDLFGSKVPLITQSPIGSSKAEFENGTVYDLLYSLDVYAGQDATDFIPVDFLGLNTIIHEPLSLETNTLGFDFIDPLPYDVSNSGYFFNINVVNDYTHDQWGFGDTIVSSNNQRYTPPSSLLNSVILNRQGPYGWSSFQQIRGANHPIVRAHNKNNILSFLYNNTRIVNLRVPVLDLSEPVDILEVKNPSYSLLFRDSYLLRESEFPIEKLKRVFGISASKQSDLPYGDFTYLDYTQRIFPRSTLVGQEEARNRDGALFTSWRPNKLFRQQKIRPIKYDRTLQKIFLSGQEILQQDGTTNFMVSDPMRDPLGSELYGGFSFSSPWPLDGNPTLHNARNDYLGLTGTQGLKTIFWVSPVSMYTDKHSVNRSRNQFANILLYRKEFSRQGVLDLDELGANPLSLDFSEKYDSETAGILQGTNKLGSIITRAYNTTLFDQAFYESGNVVNPHLGPASEPWTQEVADLQNGISKYSRRLSDLSKFSKISYTSSMPIFKTMKDIMYGVDKELFNKLEQASETKHNQLGDDLYVSNVRIRSAPNRGAGVDGGFDLVTTDNSGGGNAATEGFIRFKDAQIDGNGVKHTVHEFYGLEWQLAQAKAQLFDPQIPGDFGILLNPDFFLFTGKDIYCIPERPNSNFGTSEVYIHDNKGVLVAILRQLLASHPLADSYYIGGFSYDGNVQWWQATWYVDENGHVTSPNGKPVRKSLSLLKGFPKRRVHEEVGSSSLDLKELRKYFFTNIVAGSDQKWTAHLDHPVGGPNYETYAKYASDIVPIAKDFSALPEFRVHNFMNEILESSRSPKDILRRSGNYLEIPETLDLSKVPETMQQPITELRYNINNSPTQLDQGISELVQSSSVDSRTPNFYTEYSTTELLKVFDLIESEGLDARVKKLKLKLKGIKKFLPYSGFYPVERTSELATHFASSYYGTFDRDPRYSQGDYSHVPWMEALFAPGLLFNTIKSSLAVDYPIFTKPYKITDVSPYVVNYKQIGISPTDYEYDVAPIVIAGSEEGGELGKRTLGKYNTYKDVNDSPYKPEQGIGSLQPPKHSFGSSLETEASLTNSYPLFVSPNHPSVVTYTSRSWESVSPNMQSERDDQLAKKYSFYNGDAPLRIEKTSHAEHNLKTEYLNPTLVQKRDASYGRLMSCGNMYSPYYYKKYYTEQDQLQIPEEYPHSQSSLYSGSFVSPVRYALGGYTGAADEGFNYRIPFEAIVDPEIIRKDIRCFSSHGWHQEGYIDAASRMTSSRNERYRSASSNFFAECIEFFLKDSELTKVSSMPDTDASFGVVRIPRKDYEYRMRFLLLKDPSELKNLRQTGEMDYLDVVTSFDVEHHTGTAYQNNIEETPQETFRSFLLSYFDKWDYKKGATYENIKNYHNFSDLDLMGLNFNFSHPRNRLSSVRDLNAIDEKFGTEVAAEYEDSYIYKGLDSFGKLLYNSNLFTNSGTPDSNEDDYNPEYYREFYTGEVTLSNAEVAKTFFPDPTVNWNRGMPLDNTHLFNQEATYKGVRAAPFGGLKGPFQLSSAGVTDPFAGGFEFFMWDPLLWEDDTYNNNSAPASGINTAFQPSLYTTYDVASGVGTVPSIHLLDGSQINKIALMHRFPGEVEDQGDQNYYPIHGGYDMPAGRSPFFRFFPPAHGFTPGKSFNNVRNVYIETDEAFWISPPTTVSSLYSYKGVELLFGNASSLSPSLSPRPSDPFGTPNVLSKALSLKPSVVSTAHLTDYPYSPVSTFGDHSEYPHPHLQKAVFQSVGESTSGTIGNILDTNDIYATLYEFTPFNINLAHYFGSAASEVTTNTELKTDYNNNKKFVIYNNKTAFGHPCVSVEGWNTLHFPQFVQNLPTNQTAKVYPDRPSYSYGNLEDLASDNLFTTERNVRLKNDSIYRKYVAYPVQKELRASLSILNFHQGFETYEYQAFQTSGGGNTEGPQAYFNELPPLTEQEEPNVFYYMKTRVPDGFGTYDKHQGVPLSGQLGLYDDLSYHNFIAYEWFWNYSSNQLPQGRSITNGVTTPLWYMRNNLRNTIPFSPNRAASFSLPPHKQIKHWETLYFTNGVMGLNPTPVAESTTWIKPYGMSMNFIPFGKDGDGTAGYEMPLTDFRFLIRDMFGIGNRKHLIKTGWSMNSEVRYGDQWNAAQIPYNNGGVAYPDKPYHHGYGRFSGNTNLSFKIDAIDLRTGEPMGAPFGVLYQILNAFGAFNPTIAHAVDLEQHQKELKIYLYEQNRRIVEGINNVFLYGNQPNGQPMIPGAVAAYPQTSANFSAFAVIGPSVNLDPVGQKEAPPPTGYTDIPDYPTSDELPVYIYPAADYIQFQSLTISQVGNYQNDPNMPILAGDDQGSDEPIKLSSSLIRAGRFTERRVDTPYGEVVSSVNYLHPPDLGLAHGDGKYWQFRDASYYDMWTNFGLTVPTGLNLSHINPESVGHQQAIQGGLFASQGAIHTPGDSLNTQVYGTLKQYRAKGMGGTNSSGAREVSVPLLYTREVSQYNTFLMETRDWPSAAGISPLVVSGRSPRGRMLGRSSKFPQKYRHLFTHDWRPRIGIGAISGKTIDYGDYVSPTRGIVMRSQRDIFAYPLNNDDWLDDRNLVYREELSLPRYTNQRNFMHSPNSSFRNELRDWFLKEKTERDILNISAPPLPNYIPVEDLARSYPWPDPDSSASFQNQVGENFTRDTTNAPYISRTPKEVGDHNNSLYDDHSYVGFMEPIVSYDFRPYTPPYYEGFCYVEYIFRPEREGKHSLSEIIERTEVDFYRKRDRVKYANAQETEPFVANYWHKHKKFNLDGTQVSHTTTAEEPYYQFLNPENLKNKIVGSANPDSVKLFPDLTANRRDAYLKYFGGDEFRVDDPGELRFDYPENYVGNDAYNESFRAPVGIKQSRAVNDLKAQTVPLESYLEYMRTRTDDPESPNFLETRRSYSDSTETELLTYLPNRLKSSRKVHTLSLQNNDLSSHTKTKFISQVDNWLPETYSGSLDFTQGTPVVITEEDGKKILEISFTEAVLNITDPFESFTTSGVREDKFSFWADVLTQGLTSFRQEDIASIFLVGSEVTIETPIVESWVTLVAFANITNTVDAETMQQQFQSAYTNPSLQVHKLFYDPQNFETEQDDAGNTFLSAAALDANAIPVTLPLYSENGLNALRFIPSYDRKLTFKVESIDVPTRKVRLSFHSGSWQGYEGEISKNIDSIDLNSLLKPSVTNDQLEVLKSTYNVTGTETGSDYLLMELRDYPDWANLPGLDQTDNLTFSDATVITITHPEPSVELSPYGYIPRFCGLDYPESAGFLVNESTWNRLNPRESKTPLFVDRSSDSYFGRPITSEENDDLPNLGHFYDHIELEYSIPSVLDASSILTRLPGDETVPEEQRFPLLHAKEKVINWRVCPLVTTPQHYDYGTFEYIPGEDGPLGGYMHRGIISHKQIPARATGATRFYESNGATTYATPRELILENQPSKNSFLNNSHISSYKSTSPRFGAETPVYSPTSQGDTSYLFYRWNNRIDGRKSLNYLSEMNIDSSFNLFGMSNVQNLEFSPSGELTVVKSDSAMGSRWVISPKFEAPVLNFSKWLERENRHILKVAVPNIDTEMFNHYFGSPPQVITRNENWPDSGGLNIGFNIHGPAVGIEKLRVDTSYPPSRIEEGYLLSQNAVILAGATSGPEFEAFKAYKESVRQEIAQALIQELRNKITAGHANFTNRGGMNWGHAADNSGSYNVAGAHPDGYSSVNDIVYYDDASGCIVIVGPPLDPESKDYNYGKFKIVNSTLPVFFETGHGVNQISYFDVSISQECGQYVYADRIEPENYKRRDSDIIPEPVVGMWHQEGEIPNDKEGLCVFVSDSPGELTASAPASAVISVESTLMSLGSGVSLITHEGFVEAYVHTTSQSALYDTPGGIKIESNLIPPSMSVVVADLDGSIDDVEFAAGSASLLADCINEHSSNFKAVSINNEVHINTINLTSKANFSKVTTSSSNNSSNEPFVIQKQFSGAGKTVSEYGSLADLVGFKKMSIKPLGRIAESKKVREAVLAIPTTSQGFIKLDRRDISAALSSDSTRDVPESIVHMVTALQNYVLPPHLDFINNADIDPFLIYVLEFEHEFSKQDLADIWQNLYPRDSRSVEVVESEFTHDLDLIPQFNLDDRTRWMVFKVKQRAEKSYFNKVNRSIKDMAVIMKRSRLDSLSMVEEEPTYSYNWPYDYFSLIELVKMDAEIDLSNGDIPSFEEYMEASRRLAGSEDKTPQELVSMVESASIRRDQMEEKERKERMAQEAAARKRRLEARRLAQRRPRAESRPIWRGPEGATYIINDNGSRVYLNTDAEGNKYYYAVRDQKGAERASSRLNKYSYKVIIKPSAIYSQDSEGSITTSSRSGKRRAKNKKTNKKRGAYRKGPEG